jgi:putative ABC transport system ATP-binding protein
LLFADEPTGNLDRRTGAAVSDLLFALNREHGTTLVLVTHDATLAERCERILRLADGRIDMSATGNRDEPTFAREPLARRTVIEDKP